MRLTIEHTTIYRYSQPVRYGLQQLRMTPKSRAGHEVLSWATEISGGSKQSGYDDHHNNHVELVAIDDGQQEVTIRGHGMVETTDAHGVVGPHRGNAPLWLFLRSTPMTKTGPGLRALLKGFSPDPDDQVGTLHALSARILEAITYQIGETHSMTTSEDAIAHGYGVCQDHSHVFVTAARHLGFPARYVSGYLMMNETEIQDATHAWAEAHVDGLGWVGFDISNQVSPDELYVRIATGLDYDEASPISGLRYGQADEEMLVTVQVQQ